MKSDVANTLSKRRRSYAHGRVAPPADRAGLAVSPAPEVAHALGGGRRPTARRSAAAPAAAARRGGRGVAVESAGRTQLAVGHRGIHFLAAVPNPTWRALGAFDHEIRRFPHEEHEQDGGNIGEMHDDRV